MSDEQLLNKIANHIDMEPSEIERLLAPSAERLGIEINDLTMNDLRDIVSDLTQDVLMQLKDHVSKKVV